MTIPGCQDSNIFYLLRGPLYQYLIEQMFPSMIFVWILFFYFIYICLMINLFPRWLWAFIWNKEKKTENSFWCISCVRPLQKSLPWLPSRVNIWPIRTMIRSLCRKKWLTWLPCAVKCLFFCNQKWRYKTGKSTKTFLKNLSQKNMKKTPIFQGCIF